MHNDQVSTTFDIRGMFEASDITFLLLKFGFQPFLGNDSSEPVYYESKEKKILVLPPATDNETSQSPLKGITTIINNAYKANAEIFQDKGFLFIPVFEEQQYIVVKSRRFWVLLQYEFSTNQLTMIDTTGPIRSSLYKTSYMEEAFKKGMLGKNLTPFSMKKTYLNVLNVQDKSDSNSSGHWITYFLYRLNTGTTLDDIQEEINKKELTLETIYNIFKRLCIPDSESQAKPKALDTNDQFPPNKEDQNYAVGKSSNTLRNLGKNTGFNLDPGDEIPKSQFSAYAYFKFNFYSTLILSGTMVSLIGLLCLANQITLLATAASATILSAGMITVMVGLLGKCGLFSESSNKISAPESTSVTYHAFPN